MSDQLRYPNVRRYIAETPWAILPAKMADIMEFVAIKASGVDLTAEEIHARLGAATNRKRPQSTGEVAVMSILGTVAHRANLLTESSGGASIERITSEFRALVNDPSVAGIVLDIDSPGGSVFGVDELAAEIYAARRKKPVVAVANALMASAAYWIGAAATELVVTPSALVGSIGVIAAHEDQSALYEKLGVKVSLVTAGKYKAENNPFEPMTEEGQAEIQKRVDESYGRFTRAVAKGRGVPVETVRSGFGEGRVVGAQEAVQLGMADRIATIDEVIASMPINRESSTSGATAELVAVPYEEHGQRVLADVAAFIQATRDRVEYRRDTDSGRNLLSEAHHERLVTLDARLRELIAETDPTKPRIDQAEVFRLRARLHDIDLLLAQ